MVNWQEYGSPFLDFTEEITQEWINLGFSKESCQEWLNIGYQASDSNYCARLRDVQQKDSSWALNYSQEEGLRKEYADKSKTIKNTVAENQVNIQQKSINAQEWLDKEYKDNRDSTREIYFNEKELFGELNLSEFTSLWEIYISIHTDENRLEIKNKRKEAKIIKCVNAQEWLDQNYLQDGICQRETDDKKGFGVFCSGEGWNNKGKKRKEVIKLDLSKQNLEGHLDLSDFTNIEELDCSGNKLTSLNINNCFKLKILDCKENQLSDLDLINCQQLKKLNCGCNYLKEFDYSNLNTDKLVSLDISNNNLSSQDCLIFSSFINTSWLRIGNRYYRERINKGIYNRFHGNLESFRGLDKLSLLDICNTDIIGNIEDLPYDVNQVYCSTQERPESLVQVIAKQLEPFLIDEGFGSHTIKKNAQTWLNKHYPLEKRSEIKKININLKKMVGGLNLVDFVNLEKLKCGGNSLTNLDVSKNIKLTKLDCHDCFLSELDISNCFNLEKLNCSYNQLTNIPLPPNPKKITHLNIAKNKFPSQHISSFLDLNKFTNLEKLDISHNPFFGNLESLRKIKEINTWGTKLSSGSDHLGIMLTGFTEEVPKQKLKQIIKEKVNTYGTIEAIIPFQTWFNPNCFIVINKVKKYAFRLIIYEPSYKKMEDIIKIIRFPNDKPWDGYKTLGKAQEKARKIQEKLNSEHPILAICPKKSFYPNKVIEKKYLDIKEVKSSPDEYLKQFDIVWRKMDKTPNFYHAGIYLGESRIAHIATGIVGREEKEEISKNSTNNIFRVIKGKLFTKKEFSAYSDTWANFLGGKEGKIIRYHIIIPFKRPEKIKEHVLKTVVGKYAERKYDLFGENCEHFATMCVCSIPFSQQADKFKLLLNNIDLGEEIVKNEEMLDKFSGDEEILKVKLAQLATIKSNIISRLGEYDKNPSWELDALLMFYLLDREKWIGRIYNRFSHLRLDESFIFFQLLDDLYNIQIEIFSTHQQLMEVQKRQLSLSAETQGEIKSIKVDNEELELQTKPIELDNYNWKNIHSSFTDELVKKWQGLGFISGQVRDWINIGLQPTDHNFCSWLRDTKNLTPEKLLNHYNLEQLNQEFFSWWQEQQQTQIEQPPK